MATRVGIVPKERIQIPVGCAVRTINLNGAHSTPYKGKP